MLIKNQAAENIRFADTMKEDCFEGTDMRFVIANPPFGESWQTPEYFEYMAFPRLLAMSEVQWTQPEHKDFESFARRLDKEFERLDYCGVNACRNFYEVNSGSRFGNDGGGDPQRPEKDDSLLMPSSSCNPYFSFKWAYSRVFTAAAR